MQFNLSVIFQDFGFVQADIDNPLQKVDAEIIAGSNPSLGKLHNSSYNH